MKNIIILIFLLSVSYTCKANDIAIDAVKSHAKIIHFLSDKSPNHYNVSFQQIELGGICGFVGCNWRILVSIVVTSKQSNAPSKTILALVEGMSSQPDDAPTVSFINLKNNRSDNLVFIN
jgi:hypothetical protein